MLGDGFVAPALEAMAPRGRIVTSASRPGAEVTFNMQVLYRKMISLLGYGGTILTREERRPGLEAALRALAEARSGSGSTKWSRSTRSTTRSRAPRERRVQGKLLLDLS